MPELNAVPTVSVVENRAVVTSANIAEAFGMNHIDLVVAIESVDVPDIFRRYNFKPFVQVISSDLKRVGYYITLDGFIIVSHLLGQQWGVSEIIAYIDAFNKVKVAISEANESIAVRAKRIAGEHVGLFSAHLESAKVAGNDDPTAIVVADREFNAEMGFSFISKYQA